MTQPHSARRHHLRVITRAAAGTAAVVALAACGGSSSAASKVATLSTGGATGAATTTTLSPKQSQEAILAYAACMRENGIPMKDPTFDADGNMTGGGFGGRDSGIDPRSTEFQTAQKACGSLIQGVDVFRGRRGNFDPTKIQAAMNDFTACLRNQGLQVDDITFGRPGGDNGGDGANGNGGSLPFRTGTGGTGGSGTDGSVPPGGFNGGPPDSFPRGDNAPGGTGFDPTQRLIERLGLDATDPAVKSAVDACRSILTNAFQPTTTTAG